MSDVDPAGASWFEGEGCVLCTDPMWSLDIK